MSDNEKPTQAQQADKSKDNVESEEEGINELFNVRKNPFELNDPFIHMLAKFAEENELRNLRQLSTTYYGLMNSNFLDKYNKSMTLQPLYKATGWRRDRTVTYENAYVLREIIFQYNGFENHENHKLASFNHFAGYIKTIIFKVEHQDTEVGELAHFLLFLQECRQLFRYLTKLEFICHHIRINSVDTIREITELFPQNVQITIRTIFRAHYPMIYYVNLYGALTAYGIKILANLTIGSLIDLSYMAPRIQRDAQFYQNNFQIKFPVVQISLVDHPWSETKENLLIVLPGLLKLGTEIRFSGSNANEFNWIDQLPNSLNWKVNISKLHFSVYSLPLMYLKDFENLIGLDLKDGNFNACLFVNPMLSAEDNLAQVFEEMWKLQVTFIISRQRFYVTPAIYPDNPLALVLAKLVHHVEFVGQKWNEIQKEENEKIRKPQDVVPVEN